MKLTRNRPFLPPLLRLIAEWGVLFVILVLSIWAATQSREAPLLILLAALYVITINFSLPPAQSNVGLVPVVAVSSLLVVGGATAVTLLLVGHLLAELTRPIWQPLWDTAVTTEATSRSLRRPPLLPRLVNTLIHLLALLAATAAYQQYGGSSPPDSDYAANAAAFLATSVAFGLVYVGLNGLWWAAAHRATASVFWQHNLFPLLTAGFLALPFAILGGITYSFGGLAPFILFCLGTAVFSVVIWLSWQRRSNLEQQLAQFNLLNRSGHALQETLDLPEVLGRTHQLVATLVEIDQFTIYLREENEERWAAYSAPSSDHRSPITDYRLPITEPDDFTNWVAANGRPLNIDPRNLHFATRHNLALPTPPPISWLGLPLLLGNNVIGVMVLQRFKQARPYSQWQQEILRAVATQVSTAIQNARLYNEIVRLYNLTDEALTRRVQQLQALLNAMAEAVLLVDRHGEIILVNNIAVQLLGDGLPPQGANLETAVASALGFDATQLTMRLAALTNDQPPITPSRFTYELPAASTRRIIERQETAVFDRQNQLIGWLLLFRDITEEQELAEKRADLTRMIVHDLRNPLTTIATTIQMVQGFLPHPLPPENEASRLLQDARTTSLDLLDMVDSLMDINRMEAGQSISDPDAMRLPPLAQQVANRLQPLLAHKQITLSLEAAPDLPAVWADTELMRRVLVNLLDNALKFTPANGRITLIIQPEPALTGHEPGNRCIIQDSGPGIPPAFREQAFDRYTRTNPGGAQVRGAGLGLTYCKMAVEAQHGRIWVEDAPGGGTQFVFTLPGIPIF